MQSIRCDQINDLCTTGFIVSSFIVHVVCFLATRHKMPTVFEQLNHPASVGTCFEAIGDIVMSPSGRMKMYCPEVNNAEEHVWLSDHMVRHLSVEGVLQAWNTIM